MTKLALKGTALLIVAAVIFILGISFHARFLDKDDIQTVTDTVWVDRPLAVKDTADADTPVTVVVHDKPVETVPVVVEAPENFVEVDSSGIHQPVFLGIDHNAVHVGRNRIRVVAYDFQLERWVQQIYAVPEQKWDYGVDLTTDYFSPGDLYLSVKGRLSYRGVEFSAGPTLNPMTGDAGWTVGVTYRLIRR